MGSRRRAGILLLGLAAAVAATVAAIPAAAEPDPRYWRYDDVVERFDEWAAAHPQIFHREIIGRTLVGGDPIWAAKISDFAYATEPEARVLFHAAQHATEANGTTVVMAMMDSLLSGYDSSAQVMWMVDNLEMWFVPVVNVDGHRIAFADTSSVPMWRKTARDNDLDQSLDFPVDGVDTNRNWDFCWGDYDSTSFASPYYKGPYPFSEPEVVALRDLLLREMPVLVMDYHSPYASSPGNVIYWPWYDGRTYAYSADRAVYEPIARSLAERTWTEVDTVRYRWGPSSTVLPKEQCWVYENSSTCILLMEISSASWWTGAMVDTVAARVARGSFYLPVKAILGPGVKGRILDAATLEPVVADVCVEGFHNPLVRPPRSEAMYGSYWRLLDPGVYTIRYEAEGYRPHTANVQVYSTGYTNHDALLERLDPALADRDAAPAPRRLVWAPNPLRPGGRVHFVTRQSGAAVRLDLLDASGRRVRRLFDGRPERGSHTVALEGDLAAGVYLVRLSEAGRRSAVRKIVAAP